MSDGAVVLVLDGGGSSFKAAVYSLAERAPVAVSTEEIAAQYPSDGIVEFDPAGWWARALAALRRVVESAARLPSTYVGVICTGMRIPFVLVDDRGDELAPGVLNVDRRGTPYLDEIRDALGPERLYELTGHWPNAKFGLPKLLWYARERPRLWQRVRRVLQFHDWLVFRLSGAHASEPSSAAMSQMVDVANRTWATELLDAVGLDAGLLPELHDAGEVVGGLTPEVAREIGLKSGTPVHAGGGDTHVASVGAGAVTPGTVCIVGGSTTPLMLAAEQPTFGDPHSGPVISPHVRRDTWALETNAGATGIFYRWLRDLAGRADNGGYAGLDRLAAEAALGAHGLVVAGPNPLWGEQGWARVPPTTFLGMTPAHSLGEVARAVLESIAYAQSSNFDVLTGDPSLAVDEVQFIGGASRSPFSCQMLADVLGREVHVPEVGEPFAAGGAALVAGERTPVQPERRTYVPDGERHREYQRQAAHHYDCYVQLQEQFGT